MGAGGAGFQAKQPTVGPMKGFRLCDWEGLRVALFRAVHAGCHPYTTVSRGTEGTVIETRRGQRLIVELDQCPECGVRLRVEVRTEDVTWTGEGKIIRRKRRLRRGQ